MDFIRKRLPFQLPFWLYLSIHCMCLRPSSVCLFCSFATSACSCYFLWIMTKVSILSWCPKVEIISKEQETPSRKKWRTNDIKTGPFLLNTTKMAKDYVFTNLLIKINESIHRSINRNEDLPFSVVFVVFNVFRIFWASFQTECMEISIEQIGKCPNTQALPKSIWFCYDVFFQNSFRNFCT